jgi:hypothetical protein
MSFQNPHRDQIILSRLVSFVIFRIDNIHALLGQDPNQLVKRFGS